MPGMAKLRDEDRVYAERLGNVLMQLRAATGETRQEVADRIGVPIDTLGKWERGDNAPKGYDLGRLFRGYEEWGALWQWFFEPPQAVNVDPVRTRLDALAQSGAIASDEAAARVAARRRRAVEKRAASRDRSPKRKPPRSPR